MAVLTILTFVAAFAKPTVHAVSTFPAHYTIITVNTMMTGSATNTTSAI